MFKKIYLGVLGFVFLGLLFLSIGKLNEMILAPITTPEEFLLSQPYFNIGDIIIIQPSSSLLVFLLGVLGIGIGRYFYKTKDESKARTWWARAMVLWGVSAISAGLSYQSFGYMLKAYGREFVLHTSWPEVIYSILMVWCVAAMSIAVSYTSCIGRTRERLKSFSYIVATIYTMLSFIGVILNNKFLLSFNLLVFFLAPFFVIYFIFDIKMYLKTKRKIYVRLIICWVLLAITMMLYYGYSIMGYTQELWRGGVWFSDNDVLHLALIFWMIYIRYGLADFIQDSNNTLLNQ